VADQRLGESDGQEAGNRLETGDTEEWLKETNPFPPRTRLRSVWKRLARWWAAADLSLRLLALLLAILLWLLAHGVPQDGLF
jgi:hypothetical protein